MNRTVMMPITILVLTIVIAQASGVLDCANRGGVWVQWNCVDRKALLP